MKLKYVQDYLSITRFNDVNLPELTVITGVNGSGKSHLLEAINQRKVVIEGFEAANIVYFSYETFRLNNETSFNAQQISQERESAWTLFTQTTNANIKNNILSWKNTLGDDYTKLVIFSNEKNKSFWSLSENDINDNTLFELLKTYKQNIKNLFSNNNNLKTNQQAHAILALIKRVPFSLDEIEKDEFLKLYKPFSFKDDFLPQQLGKIIWDYYIRLRTYQINEFENEKHGKDYPVMSEEDFIKLHGEKPWGVINTILSSFSSLEYKINSPEGVDYFSNFQLKLIHTKRNNLEIGFEHLSSGERILMALVASIYKSSSDNHFPDILLLDEIDASLHPSMARNLLKVINDIFINKGVKVILVTHSPSTIALANPESIYLMNKLGENRLEKADKDKALSILTEGFATLNEGKLLFENIIQSNKDCILFTEGKTDIEHIRIAKDKLSIDDLDFDVFSCDGADKLKQFLIGIPKDLFKNKIIIGVFDYDDKGMRCIKDIGNIIVENAHYQVIDNLNIHAIMLPIPNEMLKKLAYCPIEFYFNKNNFLPQNLEKRSLTDINRLLKDEALNKEDFSQKEDICYFKLHDKFDKVNFVEKVRALPQSEFANFSALFEQLRNIVRQQLA